MPGRFIDREMTIANMEIFFSCSFERGRHQNRIVFLVLIGVYGIADTAQYQVNSMSIAGEWKFRLDSNAVGVNQSWNNQELTDRILLPGSSDEQAYGRKRWKGEAGDG